MALGACNSGGVRTVEVTAIDENPTPDVAQSKITIDREGHVVADGEDGVTVTLTVADAGGRPLNSWPVEITVDGERNALDSVSGTTDAAGQWRTVLRSTASGAKRIRAAVAPGYGLPRYEFEEDVTVRFIGNAQTISPTDSTLRLSDGSPLLATGAVPAPIEVVVRDHFGNPVPNVEVALTTTGGALTQDVTMTDLDGVVSGTLRSNAPGVETVTARITTTHGPIDTALPVEFLGDGLAFGDRRFLTSRLGAFQSVDFAGGAVSAPRSLGTFEEIPRFVVQAAPSTRPFERVALTLAATAVGTELRARRYNGRGWSVDWTSDLIEFGDSTKRGFDLAYETRSGDALAVYSDGFRTPMFRVFDGASWTDAAYLPLNDGLEGPNPDLNGGRALWIELEAHASSDTIGLVYGDAVGNVVALRWNGDEWETSTAALLDFDLQVDPNEGVACQRAFDLAFGEQSGDMVVVWGRRSGGMSSACLRQNRWTAGPVLFNLAPHFVELACEPGTDRIAYGAVEYGVAPATRFATGFWQTGTWLEQYERNIHATRTPGAIPAAMGWFGGELHCMHVNDAQANLAWLRWLPATGWVIEAGVAATGKAGTVSVQASPHADGVDFVASDLGGAVFWSRWIGAAWSQPAGAGPISVGVLPTAFAGF